MVVIRLARGGSRTPRSTTSSIAASDERRDGRFIERVGCLTRSLPAGPEALRVAFDRVGAGPVSAPRCRRPSTTWSSWARAQLPSLRPLPPEISPTSLSCISRLTWADSRWARGLGGGVAWPDAPSGPLPDYRMPGASGLAARAAACRRSPGAFLIAPLVSAADPAAASKDAPPLPAPVTLVKEHGGGIVVGARSRRPQQRRALKGRAHLRVAPGASVDR